MTGRPLEALLEAAERALRAAGAPVWEVHVEEVRAIHLEAQQGRLEAVECSVERRVVLRVLEGGIGLAVVGEGPEGTLVDAARAARVAARRARPSELRGFAGAEHGRPPAGAPFEAGCVTGALRPGLREAVLALEAATERGTERVRARPASISEVRARARVRTSSGLDVEERSTRAHAAVAAHAAGPDGERLFEASGSALQLEALDLEALALRAARSARSLLGARPVRTRRRPVVLAPPAAAELFRLLVGALAADRVEHGASFLAGRLGERVVAPAITAVDEPHDAALAGAGWYDGEGLATSRRPLITAGVPVRWLADLEASARLGLPPSGQAVRGEAGWPGPGVHGLAVSPGVRSLEALCARARGGLYVEELSGTHTMNEVTGELSLGCSGWVLRGGERAEPFEGATLAGTLLRLLGDGVELSVEREVVDDARVPAVLLEDVPVASTG